ncbi:hypothetical protein WN51_00919 [Melipona quadrifasciata]|uniref:Uncharacterized protein n=1 Tax=Melipona quadrifasciata TaxID=166423 RepID=A0A0N0U4H0_9HYME|nr:hypothetical protein WN51_00919 [Melipona quadrifasciata]
MPKTRGSIPLCLNTGKLFHPPPERSAAPEIADDGKERRVDAHLRLRILGYFNKLSMNSQTLQINPHNVQRDMSKVGLDDDDALRLLDL